MPEQLELFPGFGMPKLYIIEYYMLSDFIKNLEHISSGETEIKTGNMTGLLVGSFVHFEEIGHSVDYYDDGAKFIVTYVDKPNGKFKFYNSSQNSDLYVDFCEVKDYSIILGQGGNFNIHIDKNFIPSNFGI